MELYAIMDLLYCIRMSASNLFSLFFCIFVFNFTDILGLSACVCEREREREFTFSLLSINIIDVVGEMFAH